MRQKYFLRAGLAHEVFVAGAEGLPVLIGKLRLVVVAIGTVNKNPNSDFHDS